MIYHEVDWIAEVEILEDNSDETVTNLKLRVIKTLQESRIFIPTPNGHIFDLIIRKGFENIYGVLRLENEK